MKKVARKEPKSLEYYINRLKRDGTSEELTDQVMMEQLAYNYWKLEVLSRNEFEILSRAKKEDLPELLQKDAIGKNARAQRAIINNTIAIRTELGEILRN